MSRKTIPVSTRISPEDAEFLARWNGAGATPSEKLRALIAEAREQKEGAEDYPGALRVATALIAPTLLRIRSRERELGAHSELVSRLAEWLPECLAYLISAANQPDEKVDKKTLVRIEADLVDRAMTLMQSVLQMAVTRQSPCYHPEVIRERIGPVLDLAEVVFAENDRLKRGDRHE